MTDVHNSPDIKIQYSEEMSQPIPPDTIDPPNIIPGSPTSPILPELNCDSPPTDSNDITAPIDTHPIDLEPSPDPPPPIETPIVHSSKFIRYFNLCLMGTGFLLLFSAYGTAQGYTTMLYRDYGYVILGCIYGVFAFSNFISPMVDNRFGSRLSMVLASITYIFFVLSMATGLWYIVIIASLLIGFGAATLWTSQGAFMLLIAEKDIGMFTGIFFGMQQMSSIFGNVLGSILISFNIPFWIIFAVLAGIGLIGVVCLSVLRPYTPQFSIPPKRTAMKETFIGSFRMLVNKKMIYMLPIIFSHGFNQGVMSGKLPLLVAISLGPVWIGYVSMVMGAAETIGAVSIGKLVDKLGLKIMYVVATVLIFMNMGLTLIMDAWKPYLYLITFFVVGISDASLNTCNYSIVGKTFPKKSATAFAILICIKSLGLCAALIVSIWLPLRGLQSLNGFIQFTGFFIVMFFQFFLDSAPESDEVAPHIPLKEDESTQKPEPDVVKPDLENIPTVLSK